MFYCVALEAIALTQHEHNLKYFDCVQVNDCVHERKDFYSIFNRLLFTTTHDTLITAIPFDRNVFYLFQLKTSRKQFLIHH